MQTCLRCEQSLGGFAGNGLDGRGWSPGETAAPEPHGPPHPVLFPSHHQPVIWPLALHLLTSKTDKLVKTPRSITAVNFRTYPSLSVEGSVSTSPAHWTADLKGLHTCSPGWVSCSSATLKPWTAHGGRHRSRGCPLESGLRRRWFFCSSDSRGPHMQALAPCAETPVPSIHFWVPSRQGSFLPTKAVPS